MGFPNIPDNQVEVIPYHVTEIFIITDMGGLQHFQMGVIFAGAIPFNDFMPDGIDKGVEVLNLHGGNPIHINLNVRKKLDKVLMGGKFAEQTVVNPTAFQKCYHLITQMEVSYDTAVLTYKGINTDASVTDNNGILKIADYGKDKTCGTDNIVLTFTGKATGEAKVTVTSAKVDVKANAAEKDAPAATIATDAATITVGGYQVTLHEAFTGEGTANHGQDYTFNAKDPSKKYDFTGSTMGGKDVEVIDNGNGTYTVKNVSGELVIKATEKAGKVTINLSGDAVDTITQKSWGTATEVDAGTALWFMAQPESDKELVVTVNGEVVAGMNMQAFMRYNITADKVTGTELNIVVNYKAADQATIIESGTAWNKVKNLSRGGWEKSGDKVDAGTTLDLYFKPEDGKTIDDYVVRANGMDCTYAKVGKRYKFTIPATIITAGATVTINFDYAATPEPAITVNVSEYLNLSSKTMFLITATGDVADGKVLAYDGNAMYWSAKYNENNGAYAWLVISTDTLETVKAAATTDKFKFIDATDSNKISIAYNGDVNLTKAADINDAQLVWNIHRERVSPAMSLWSFMLLPPMISAKQWAPWKALPLPRRRTVFR